MSAVVPIMFVVVAMFSDEPYRALLMSALGLAAAGAIAIPLGTASDRRLGHLDYLRSIPYGGSEIALSRMLLSAVAALLGVGTASLLVISVHPNLLRLPFELLVSLTGLAVVATLAVSSALTPIFALLPVPFALAVPAAAVLIISKVRGLQQAGRSLAEIVMRYVTVGDSSIVVVFVLVTLWLVVAGLLWLLLRLSAKIFQPRGRPHDDAKSLFDLYERPRADA